MHYMEKRQQMTDSFWDTIEYCERTKPLMDIIMDTRRHTRIYHSPMKELQVEQIESVFPVKVLVTEEPMVETAIRIHKAEPDCKIGFLNPASATSPGGGVARGICAPEEQLCRCTTLYPCLDEESVWNAYYNLNRNGEDNLNTCIYTPGIVGIKTDELQKDVLLQREWIQVDVISCFLPRYQYWLYGGRHKEENFTWVDDAKLYHLLHERMCGVLRVAAFHQVEILIMGIC